jgi:hypothetical protein
VTTCALFSSQFFENHKSIALKIQIFLGGCSATIPVALQYPRVLFTGWGLRGLEAMTWVRVAGEAGRRALPTAGKREGISF